MSFDKMILYPSEISFPGHQICVMDDFILHPVSFGGLLNLPKMVDFIRDPDKCINIDNKFTNK